MRQEKFWKAHLLLSLLCVVLALGPLLLCNVAAWTRLSGAGTSGAGLLFGFGSDWLSQHLPIAESLRQAMLESGRLLPLYIDLGGGVSVYDFAYYGLLRPDVLLGYLFPSVGMEYILGGYAVFELLLGGNMVYIWLRGNHEQNTAGRRAAFAGSVLYMAAGCFLHAHFQLMFVNYLPFLVLALIGIDRFIEKRKGILLCVGLTLVYFHSFYYAPSCLCVAGIYYLYRVRQAGTWPAAADKKAPKGAGQCGALDEESPKRAAAEAAPRRGHLKMHVRFLLWILLSIGLAAVLLLPTGLDILSTSKDAGSFAGSKMPLVNPKLDGLLYSPYGMGLTLIGLYALLCALGKRRMRLPAVAVLAASLFPIIPFVLNGFLYARGKILIPFLLLVCLIFACICEEYFAGKDVPKVWAGLLCLMPCLLLSGKYGIWKYIDWAVLMLWILGVRQGQRLRRSQHEKNRCTRRLTAALLLIPCIFSFYLNAQSGYVSRSEIQTGAVSKAFNEADPQMDESDNYRFEILTDAFNLCNFLPGANAKRSSMYSSITQEDYAEFFYDGAKNAIPIQNRIALIPGQNVLYNYKMGVRYVLADRYAIPNGYQKISESGDYAIAENPHILPICHGTDKLVSLEDILQKAERADNSTEVEIQAKLRLSSREVRVPLDFRGRIAILSFDVTPLSPRAVVIDINGVRNKLSGSSAPYPNHNNRFNYVLSGGTDGFLIQKNANEYRIENLTLSFLDEKELYNSSGEVWKPQTHTSDAGKGQIFSGTINMKKDGYFATSYPYRKGYEVKVDGRAVSASEILKIDDTFLGLRLEEGMHEIEIRFVPPGYRTGLAISAISLLILLVLSAWQKTKHICENRVFRYLITGGMTTAVNYVIYFGLFIAAGRSVAGGTGGAADSAFSLAANSLAWLGAVIFAYFANRRFVFQSENSILHEFIQFALLRLASLTVENILLYLLLTLMAMPNAAAKISVSVITVILNYAACKYKIFSVKGETR